jgi:6-bladed beta-propeller
LRLRGCRATGAVGRALCALGLLLSALGCAAKGDAPVEEGVRLDTVAGVAHVINVGVGAWAQGGGWRVDTTGAVVIGAVDGPEPYVFGSVGGVVVAADGRIYVADAQAREIRVFSPGGEYLERFGRGGEGPGEFGHIGGLGGAPGGGVAALDGQLARVSVFDPDGRFLRSFRLERPYMVLQSGSPVRFDGEGRFYDRTGLAHGLGPDSIGVVRYAADGHVEDTTLVAVYQPQRVYVRQNGVVRMAFGIPYTPHVSVAVSTRGRVFVTRGEAYVIAEVDAAGDTVRVIERAVPPTEVSGAERDSALAAIQARYHDAVGTELPDPPAIPQRKPAVDALVADEAGCLWVLRGSAPAASTVDWDVVDGDGRVLGTLTLPAMTVMFVGERSLAGVVTDDMGVARVKVLPLDRGPAVGAPPAREPGP